MDTLATAETTKLTMPVILTSIGFWSLILFIYVIEIIAIWKIFRKAKVAGWKSLIPVYNTYILYKIVGLSFWKWLVVPAFIVGVLTIVSGLCIGFGGNYIIIGSICMLINLIIEFVVLIKFISKYAKAFGKGDLFAIGLFFFPSIFQLVLAFGDAKYVKPKKKKSKKTKSKK